MASTAQSEAQLAAAAARGDRAALQRLLLDHYDELERRIQSKLPPRLAATWAAEDILQVTFFQAFRDIGRYEAREDASFGDWLARIAEHRLLDAIKQHDCAKRGGEWDRVGEIAQGDSRSASLLDWIAADQTSPTSAIARSEALHALQVALASIPDDQREAICLRHLEGKSLEDAAAAMGRSPDAVRGLVQRGKQSLADAMGRASKWLSAK